MRGGAAGGDGTAYADRFAAETPALVSARSSAAGLTGPPLDGDRIADPRARDEQTVAWREVARAVREHEDLTSAVLPIGAGLLVAIRRR
nr:hypothetical protein [Geodermatophilus sp. DSM 45219]